MLANAWKVYRHGWPRPEPLSSRSGVGVTWVSSFPTYIEVVAQAHPDRVADMLVYMHLIIREESVAWNYIDPSFHTTYIGDQGLPPLSPCRHCSKVGHRSEACVPLDAIF